MFSDRPVFVGFDMKEVIFLLKSPCDAHAENRSLPQHDQNRYFEIRNNLYFTCK